MAIPTGPNSLADFFSQAKGFVEKAKASGADDTGIANTLRFMWQLAGANEAANKAKVMSPYEQAQLKLEQDKLDLAGKGEWVIDQNTGELYNKLTGDRKTSDDGKGNGGNQITADDFPGASPSPQSTPGTPAPTNKTSGGKANLDDIFNKAVGQPSPNASYQPGGSSQDFSDLDSLSNGFNPKKGSTLDQVNIPEQKQSGLSLNLGDIGSGLISALPGMSSVPKNYEQIKSVFNKWNPYAK